MNEINDLKEEGHRRCDFSKGMFGRQIINDLIDRAYELGKQNTNQESSEVSK